MLDIIISWLPYVALAAIFYFWILRPQKKNAQKSNEAMKSLQKGDEVMTVGGIFGLVLSIEEHTLILQTPPGNSRITLEKSFVKTIKKPDGSVLNVY